MENLHLSKQLVTLKSDLTLAELGYAVIDSNANPSSCVTDHFKWSGENQDELRKLFAELEFEGLLGKESEETRNENLKELFANKQFSCITEKTFLRFIADLNEAKEFAFDTETTSLDPLNAELVGLSFSWQEHSACFLPVKRSSPPFVDGIPLADLQHHLWPIMERFGAVKSGSNLKFDLRILLTAGCRVRGPFFDTMLASHLLRPDRRHHGLKSLTLELLGEEMATFEELTAKSNSILTAPEENIVRYACHDADASFRLKLLLDQQLGESTELPSVAYLLKEVENPLVPILAEMEQRGIQVDREFLEQLQSEFSAELTQLEVQIHQLAGRHFNLNSPKQLSELLFNELKLPTAGIKKTQGGLSTDSSVLEKLLGTHPIIPAIMEYREIFKLLSTYVEALMRLSHPVTGRVHTSFNQAITATGRLSSTDPNLQNIPIRTIRGRRLREAFIASSGNLLLSADYSQIELRLLAHLSEDEALRRAFKNDEDIHTATARELFPSVINPTPEQQAEERRIAKTINFGVVYGMGAFKLAGTLGISRARAQMFIDSYFKRYSGVKAYFDRLIKQANERGYVETLCGRRRSLSDVETAGRDRGYAERSLVNTPIQGSAAEVIKLAMIRIEKRLEAEPKNQCALLLQVHDELIYEVKESEAERYLDLLRKEMEAAVELAVPLKVSATIGKRWTH